MPGWLRSLWATNTAALIGFGAAVVAVVAAGLIAYLDKRNERSADKRAAIRLVLAEMGSDLDSLDWFVYTGRRPLAPITTTAWRTQKETLARYLTEFQWTTSAGFYERLVQSAPSLRHRRCVPRQRRAEAKAALIEGEVAIHTLDSAYNDFGAPRGLPCKRSRGVG